MLSFFYSFLFPFSSLLLYIYIYIYIYFFLKGADDEEGQPLNAKEVPLYLGNFGRASSGTACGYLSFVHPARSGLTSVECLGAYTLLQKVHLQENALQSLAPLGTMYVLMQTLQSAIYCCLHHHRHHRHHLHLHLHLLLLLFFLVEAFCLKWNSSCGVSAFNYHILSVPFQFPRPASFL